MHTPPAEYYEMLGRAASNCAALEGLLDRACCQLANTDAYLGACLTAQFTGLSARLRALEALLERRFPGHSLGSKLKRLCREANRVFDKRNRLVHDPMAWDEGRGTPVRLQISAHPKPIYDFFDISVDSAKALVKDTGELLESFNDFLNVDVPALMSERRF